MTALQNPSAAFRALRQDFFILAAPFRVFTKPPYTASYFFVGGASIF
jgi:hypothetical protein